MIKTLFVVIIFGLCIRLLFFVYEIEMAIAEHIGYSLRSTREFFWTSLTLIVLSAFVKNTKD